MVVCTYVTFQSSMSRSPSCPLCHLSLALDTKLVVQTVCILTEFGGGERWPTKTTKPQNSSHWQTTSALGWLSGTWGLRSGGVLGWCLTDKELMWVPVDTTARCEKLSVQSCIIRGDVKKKASPAYVWAGFVAVSKGEEYPHERCGGNSNGSCIQQPCCLDPCHLNWHYKWV